MFVVFFFFFVGFVFILVRESSMVFGNKLIFSFGGKIGVFFAFVLRIFNKICSGRYVGIGFLF